MTHTITLTIEGPSEKDGNVLLADFVNQLRGYKETLAHTDKLLHDGVLTADLHVVGLSHSSPATVQVAIIGNDPQYDSGAAIVEGFKEAIEAVSRRKPLPGWVDDKWLRMIERVAKPVGGSIARGSVKSNGTVVAITETFKQRVHLLLVPDISCHGSTRGRLLNLDFHGPKPQIVIYPKLGPGQLRCTIPVKLKEKAVKALEKEVEVHGVQRFSKASSFPSAMDVDEIVILEEPISLIELRGIAPDLAGTESSEEFVKRIRSEWS